MNKSEARLRFKLQSEILDRADMELEEFARSTDRVSVTMDLDSCKFNVESLEALLHAPPFDFAHDIYGIIRHMDRSTYPGKLQHCFVPRCTRKEVA